MRGGTRIVEAEIPGVWIRDAFFGVELHAVHENRVPFAIGLEIGGEVSRILVPNGCANGG